MLLTIPPMTTVASGRWTPPPTPTFTAIGMKPTAATSAVMSIGRRLKYNSTRINDSASGTTNASLRLERSVFSNCPPHLR